MMRIRRLVGFSLLIVLLTVHARADQAPLGYYRQPAIHNDTIVFVAEGDLWIWREGDAVARRLTTHRGDESHPAISPDGQTIAFSAQYEGPTEVYTMPIDGGIPTRLTWEGRRALVVRWSPSGEILYATRHFSTLPNWQLAVINPDDIQRNRVIPLAEAADGVVGDDGESLFFTRLAFQGSHTRRYKGGTAQQIWKWFDEQEEAIPLTTDYPGTSKEPMWWDGRVYFASDRHGTMNIWSMKPDGSDLVQHTEHEGFDLRSPDLHNGRIVYQLGADVWRYDIAGDRAERLEIRLASDFDQLREKWVTKPMDWLTAGHISPDGDRVVLTARGDVFVVPHRQGRLVEATRESAVRYRSAQFMPDGKRLLALSDQSGEVEFWTLPANGVGETRQITSDAEVLRYGGAPSPDGTWLAHHDKNWRLWLTNIESGETKQIDESAVDQFRDLAWSPDSRWLTYVRPATNEMLQVWLYEIESGRLIALTSDRTTSQSPAWDPGGAWLYFLSDRHLRSVVRSPWGLRAPKPFFDRQTKILAIALNREARFPFDPKTELDKPADEDKDEKEEPEEKETQEKNQSEPAEQETEEAPAEEDGEKEVAIDTAGLATRLYEVPVPPGNYRDLFVTDKRLFWITSDPIANRRDLTVLKIANRKIEPKVLVGEIDGVELSLDRKKILISKKKRLSIIKAGASAPADLADLAVNVEGWKFTVDAQEEFRQMFVDAWRLERDYFYDRDMHGVDWPAMLEKYRPLVDRVRTRSELSDLIAQMVAELSALHTFVYGGDLREPPVAVQPASLGARLTRDQNRGGYVIDHIFRDDPEYPAELSPLAKPGLDIAEGDVIEMINGVSALSGRDVGALLRNQVGRQVLLRIKDAETEESRDVVVKPISPARSDELRYSEWELTRREIVEDKGGGAIGYVHLRAMGANDIAQWTRDFYPVFNRKGLILDVRHNRGGNIDSWILSELARTAWFFWQPRIGQPFWNMQFAFRGHLVILCNQRTASDGEAITEGVRRLGLGTIIGMRTWGGEIWLSSSNVLVDRGIATASEIGVYGPEGVWLIEGHGVDPDIEVDNLPHATFEGDDAQLARAIEFLKNKIAEEPIEAPPAPAHPDKAEHDDE